MIGNEWVDGIVNLPIQFNFFLFSYFRVIKFSRCYNLITNFNYFKRAAKAFNLVLRGPAKWRVTVSEELQFMTSYLGS